MADDTDNAIGDIGETTDSGLSGTLGGGFDDFDGGFGDFDFGDFDFGGTQDGLFNDYEGSSFYSDDLYSDYGYFERAWDAFSDQNWAYAFENLGYGLFEGVLGYFGAEVGSTFGVRIGGLVGGLPGALIGYIVGSIYGKKFGEELADALINGEPGQLNEQINNIAEQNGVSPGDVLKAIVTKIDEEGLESIIKDIADNYDFKTYGLSRRRSNIIGTGRRGLTIE